MESNMCSAVLPLKRTRRPIISGPVPSARTVILSSMQGLQGYQSSIMYMPEDLLFEILSKLPLKSAVRFKCVSKSWLALIGIPEFMYKLNLNCYFNCNNEDVTHLIASCRVGDTRMVSMLSLKEDDTEEGDGSNRLQVDVVASVGQSSSLSSSFFESLKFITRPQVLGPIDGIACLFFEPDRFAIWNPATGDFRALPVSNVFRPQNIIEDPLFGFEIPMLKACSRLGFDSNSNDYKVVQILTYVLNHYEKVHQVELYDFSRLCWRKLDTFLPAFPIVKMASVTYRKTICCWWAIKPAVNGDPLVEVILSLDMHTEVFQITPLPSAIHIGSHFTRKAECTMRVLLPFNDSNSIALVNYPAAAATDDEKVLDIWVLNQLGVEESWSKLLRIGPMTHLERPLCFWKNGRFLLQRSCGKIISHQSWCSSSSCPTQEELIFVETGFVASPGSLLLLAYKPGNPVRDLFSAISNDDSDS